MQDIDVATTVCLREMFLNAKRTRMFLKSQLRLIVDLRQMDREPSRPGGLVWDHLIHVCWANACRAID